MALFDIETDYDLAYSNVTPLSYVRSCVLELCLQFWMFSDSLTKFVQIPRVCILTLEDDKPFTYFAFYDIKVLDDKMSTI
jgi:hypothetical protein